MNFTGQKTKYEKANGLKTMNTFGESSFEIIQQKGLEYSKQGKIDNEVDDSGVSLEDSEIPERKTMKYGGISFF